MARDPLAVGHEIGSLHLPQPALPDGVAVNTCRSGGASGSARGDGAAAGHSQEEAASSSPGREEILVMEYCNKGTLQVGGLQTLGLCSCHLLQLFIWLIHRIVT